jgi:nicotinamide phosphoribosyltransferase
MKQEIYDSVIFDTDSYKVSMHRQYPPGTEIVHSYIESRGGKYDQTVFFGLQAYIKKYLMTPFTQEQIDFAEKFYAAHGEPFNKAGWEGILRDYAGYLPVRIRALQEGTVLPLHNCMATVENIDPEYGWVTTHVETGLLRSIWYGVTVATQSWTIKQLIRLYLETTGDVAGLNFKLHDFGARGVSSKESAGAGGAAHLVNFLGTDTIVGVLHAMQYYNADVCGFSIPAAEHSTITSWGKDREEDAYRNMIRTFGGNGKILAVVSDSYDIFNACRMWGNELKQEVLESGATVVIRSDSGDPATVVLQCVEILGEGFGYTVNAKGYKVLNTVRVIQGDGINYDSIEAILVNLVNHGWSADNVAFGMGGALLQQVNRDTQQFAMKCSAIRIMGKWQDVFKQPKTDSGKNSKRGRLTTVEKDKEFKTIRIEELEGFLDLGWKEALDTVFVAGKLLRDENFQDIRDRAESYATS